MHSKRSREGYLEINHRGPGVSDAMVARAGMPEGSGQGLFQAPTIGCSHCQKQQIMNPLRTRERPYCRKCDDYICEDCNLAAVLTGECRPFQQFCDQAAERASRGLQVPIFQRNTHG